MGEITRANRLWQMRRLVKLCGGSKAAADKIKKNSSYITAIAGPNPQRAIGDKMAAHIEKSFGLLSGELDCPPPAQISGEDTLIGQIVEILANTTKEDKELILSIADLVVSRSLNSRAKAGQ